MIVSITWMLKIYFSFSKNTLKWQKIISQVVPIIFILIIISIIILNIVQGFLIPENITIILLALSIGCSIWFYSRKHFSRFVISLVLFVLLIYFWTFSWQIEQSSNYIETANYIQYSNLLTYQNIENWIGYEKDFTSLSQKYFFVANKLQNKTIKSYIWFDLPKQTYLYNITLYGTVWRYNDTWYSTKIVLINEANSTLDKNSTQINFPDIEFEKDGSYYIETKFERL